MSNKSLSEMRSKILEKQVASSSLEPHKIIRKEWEQAVLKYANDFIDTLSIKKAFESNYSAADYLIEDPITNEGVSIEELISILDKSVDNTGLNPAGAGHLGYIPGGGIYSSALGDYLAAVFNRYAGIYYASPGAVNMEHRMIKWMCQLFDLPAEAGGTLCSGGSIANLTAIITARDHKNITSDRVKTSVIYLTSHIHHCMNKALRIAGLGECIIRYVPMTEGDKMDPKSLITMIKKDQSSGLNPWMLAVSAGTTDTGAIDPLYELSIIAEENGLWYHIDAAYGGFFILVPEIKPKLKGIENADSLVIDPHKGLFLPYGLGVVLVKNVNDLLKANYYLANYMQDAYAGDLPPSPADLSPELTRHFRALRMWLPIKLHGLQPFKEALDEKIQLAKYTALKLQEIDHIVIRSDPELSVVCFRVNGFSEEINNKYTKALLQHIVSDGKVFMSSTILDANTYIRIAILSFRTHIETIDLALIEIEQKLSVIIAKNG